MPSLRSAISDIYEAFEFDSCPFFPGRWQGMNVRGRPEAEMREMLHVNIEAKLLGEDLEVYRKAIRPNLPWADAHFDERVCGYPINPGLEWKNWPYAASAEKSLNQAGMFNHNYMERYWPRLARLVRGNTPAEYQGHLNEKRFHSKNLPRYGIGGDYGDLGGLVRDLAGEPDTRQAYLPVWFPEDTGDAHNGRKPCTLGYHFIMRRGQLDVVYYLRSCDLAHHFRDDLYLTVRLLLWVLVECRKLNPGVWDSVQPGRMIVQITNLHMFINDFRKEYGE